MNYSKIIFYYPNGLNNHIVCEKVSMSKCNFLCSFFEPVIVFDKKSFNVYYYSNIKSDDKLISLYNLSLFIDKR